ncbi:sigma-70 family RNA polymerase sigma factor [Kibdelosporangium philippinense]|uniref:Sigma-70 family RNA polymerase sigma factor n=1 Tax=Kibdelosporangium philippinense TaxID=211113 RepID=A0ABS8ZRY8_9PSEU|nr:sigma-70 family RNA polymerase sigma factor [Kibdelosporangium philippinense]MCE7009988.1 sigma-70 family RNA polymerase sigma factor [Kibdelosporangium philippinense]
MRLPPTTDSEDRRVAVLRDVWAEFYAYVRRLLPGEYHLVEDFMQEAAADLTRYWRDRGEVTRNQAAAILKQAAKFDVINHRNAKAHTTISAGTIDDELMLTAADPNSEHEILAVMGRIDHDRLIHLLPRLLTDRQRQIVVAVDVEGLTQSRAAQQLGISVRGLQKARDTALTRLQHHLTSPPAPHAEQMSRPNREVPQ